MTESNDKKARILLVDDSKLIRRAAEKMLGKVFDVLLAEDGVEGWQKVSSDPTIQMVFSDLMMPNMDGYQLLEKIRGSEDDRIRQLPVVIVTGADNNAEAKEKAFVMGATDFVTKPFNSTDIKARAHAHVGHQLQAKTLLEQVNIDRLTGLLNKQAFDARLAKDISFTSRHQQDLAVMLIEMDDYKSLFERVGRKGYDSILKQVAKVLQAAVRKEDTVSRSGLARFLVSLPTAKTEGAGVLAKRICSKVAAFNMSYKGERLAISLSIGVCTVVKGQRPDQSKLMDVLALALAKAQQGSDVCTLGLEGEVLATRLSVDQLLRELEFSGKLNADVAVDQLIVTLKPLVALMTEEQRQELVG